MSVTYSTPKNRILLSEDPVRYYFSYVNFNNSLVDVTSFIVNENAISGDYLLEINNSSVEFYNDISLKEEPSSLIGPDTIYPVEKEICFLVNLDKKIGSDGNEYIAFNGSEDDGSFYFLDFGRILRDTPAQYVRLGYYNGTSEVNIVELTTGISVLSGLFFIKTYSNGRITVAQSNPSNIIISEIDVNYIRDGYVSINTFKSSDEYSVRYKDFYIRSLYEHERQLFKLDLSHPFNSVSDIAQNTPYHYTDQLWNHQDQINSDVFKYGLVGSGGDSFLRLHTTEFSEQKEPYNYSVILDIFIDFLSTGNIEFVLERIESSELKLVIDDTGVIKLQVNSTVLYTIDRESNHDFYDGVINKNTRLCIQSTDNFLKIFSYSFYDKKLLLNVNITDGLFRFTNSKTNIREYPFEFRISEYVELSIHDFSVFTQNWRQLKYLEFDNQKYMDSIFDFTPGLGVSMLFDSKNTMSMVSNSVLYPNYIMTKVDLKTSTSYKLQFDFLYDTFHTNDSIIVCPSSDDYFSEFDNLRNWFHIKQSGIRIRTRTVDINLNFSIGSIVGKHILVNIYYTYIGQFKLEFIDLTTGIIILEWETNNELEYWNTGSYLYVGLAAYGSEIIKISNIRTFFGDDIIGFGSIESHIPESLKSDTRLLMRLQEILSQEALLTPQLLPVSHIKQNAYLIQRLQEVIDSNSDLLKVFKTVQRYTYWGLGSVWGDGSWEPYYDGAESPHPDWNQVSNADICVSGIVGDNLYQRARVLVNINNLIMSIARILIKNKITIDQSGRIWGYVDDDIIFCTSHDVEGAWYSSDDFVFGLNTVYKEDPFVSYWKYKISQNQEDETDSLEISKETTEEVSLGGGVYESDTYFIIAEIYDDEDNLLGREEYRVNLDNVSPIVQKVYLKEIPLYEYNDITIGCDILNGGDTAKITWSYELYDGDNVLIDSDSFEVINPDTSIETWREHTFVSLASFDTGYHINIYVEVEDLTINSSSLYAGYNYSGDLLGRTEEDYVIKQRYVYKFAIWDMPLTTSNLNTKRCTNNKKLLMLKDECSIHESNIKFIPGSNERCPNCGYPLLEVKDEISKRFFDSNFPVASPYRGDDDSDPGILRFEPNYEFFGLHKEWHLDIITRGSRYGRDLIELGQINDSEIENGNAKANFEIVFSENESFLTSFYIDDSLSGVSGFKTKVIEIEDYEYIKYGVYKNGYVGYEPTITFEVGKTYYYKWRLIKSYIDGSLSYGSYIFGSYTFETLDTVSSVYDGSYREVLAKHGSFNGLYESSILSYVYGFISNVHKDNTSLRKLISKITNGINNFAVKLNKYDTTTNKLVIKIKSNKTNCKIKPSFYDKNTSVWTSTLIEETKQLEKDMWTVLEFNLEQTNVMFNGSLLRFEDILLVNSENTYYGFSADCQPNTEIEVDYIALVSKNNKRRYIYLNFKTDNGVCFNDRRVYSYDTDKTANSKCWKSYKPIDATVEMINGFPSIIPESLKKYQYGSQYCFNDTCPDYSPLVNIESFVEFIYDPFASLETQNIIEAEQNISGIMICPNDNINDSGIPECSNNLYMVPIAPEKKVCSRNEGILNSSRFKYKCNKFSETDEASLYDTSGKYSYDADASDGTKIPADMKNENGVFEYIPKSPTPHTWIYNDTAIFCDGILRDTGQICGSTLVGWSQGQQCKVCGTQLIPYDKYGKAINLLACSNTNKIYQIIYDCALYNNGIELDYDISNCPECGYPTAEFYARPIIESITYTKSLILLKQDIKKLLSGMVHTWAIRGWDLVLGIPYNGVIGGQGGPVVDDHWHNVTTFRPTIGTVGDSGIWEKRRNIAQSQIATAEIQETEVQSSIDLKRLDVINKFREAGNTKTYNFKLSTELLNDGYYNINLNDQNLINVLSGSSYIDGIRYINGETRVDHLVDTENNAVVQLKNPFITYLKEGSSEVFKIKVKIKSIEWKNMFQGNPSGFFWNPDGIPSPDTWYNLEGSFGIGFFYAGQQSCQWLEHDNLLTKSNMFNNSQTIMIIMRVNKISSSVYKTELVVIRYTWNKDGSVDYEEIGNPIWEESVNTSIGMSVIPGGGYGNKLLDNLNINIEFNIGKTQVLVKQWIDGSEETIVTRTVSNSTLLDSLYYGMGFSASEHCKYGISSLDTKGISSFVDLEIEDVSDEESALIKFGKYRRDTQINIDESDLLREGKDTDGSIVQYYNTEEQTETYYKIEIDTSKDFNSRSGKPLRTIEILGFTCLSKKSHYKDSFAPWVGGYEFCPNYKSKITQEKAEASKFLCPVCGNKLYKLRIDHGGISLISELLEKGPYYKSNEIVHLLNQTDIPGEAESDYFVLDINGDGNQDHITEQTFINNKFFESKTNRYTINSWTRTLKEANYIDSPDPDPLKLHNSPPESDGISDIDWATAEHIQAGHPLLETNHPFDHPMTLLWMSVGQNKINAHDQFRRSGTWGVNRKSRYVLQLKQQNTVTGDQDYFKDKIGDFRFSYYIPESLYYRSVLERFQGNNSYPTNGGNQTNKTASIKMVAGFSYSGLIDLEYATASYKFYDDYQRDTFESGFVKPSSWNSDLSLLNDTNLYRPERDIINNWYFVKPNFFDYLTLALQQYKNPSTGIIEAKTWANVNYIKIFVELCIERDQGNQIYLDNIPYSPHVRPNSCGIIIGEIQQGWKTQTKVSSSGGNILKYPPNVFDGNYYWRVVPYTLSLNEPYRRWRNSVCVPVSGNTLSKVKWNNEQAIYNFGIPPNRFVKRYGNEVGGGVLKLSKNWGTILDREELVLLPEGYE